MRNFIRILVTLTAVLLMTGCNTDKMMKGRVEKFLTGCKDNLKNIGSALDAYKKDSGGEYPKSLQVLVPKYLPKIPDCPHSVKENYSSSYKVKNGKYLVYCRGDVHKLAGIAENNPRIRTGTGVTVKKLSKSASGVFRSPKGFTLAYGKKFQVQKVKGRELALSYNSAMNTDFAPTLLVKTLDSELGLSPKSVFRSAKKRLRTPTRGKLTKTVVYPIQGVKVFTTAWVDVTDGDKFCARLYTAYRPQSGLEIEMVAVCAAKDADRFNSIFNPVVESLKFSD